MFPKHFLSLVSPSSINKTEWWIVFIILDYSDKNNINWPCLLFYLTNLSRCKRYLYLPLNTNSCVKINELIWFCEKLTNSRNSEIDIKINLVFYGYTIFWIQGQGLPRSEKNYTFHIYRWINLFNHKGRKQSNKYCKQPVDLDLLDSFVKGNAWLIQFQLS